MMCLSDDVQSVHKHWEWGLRCISSTWDVSDTKKTSFLLNFAYLLREILLVDFQAYNVEL